MSTHNKTHESSQNYLVNLEGTKDSYSDSEESSEVRRAKPNLIFNNGGNNDKLAAYSSCKKLLFKVDLIIKNAKGDVVVEKQLEKFSEIFDIDNKAIIYQVCEDLKVKARQFIEYKREEACEKEN